MTCKKSGDKWPRFKEIGTKKIKLAKVVAKEKKILGRTLFVHLGTKSLIFKMFPAFVWTLFSYTYSQVLSD